MSQPTDLPAFSRDDLLALVGELQRQIAVLTADNEALRAELDRLTRGGKRQAAVLQGHPAASAEAARPEAWIRPLPVSGSPAAGSHHGAAGGCYRHACSLPCLWWPADRGAGRCCISH
jgi:hypothetical protein